ncbi:hypothetical protein V6N11_077191 [Hibiscus sabdariffa]|uniref:Rx N-terminal domain-containing protein n=1 Tax=Hibiscus sabdariffa TaxID=183260 RepID=A0ABR2TCC4_9ROSI
MSRSFPLLGHLAHKKSNENWDVKSQSSMNLWSRKFLDAMHEASRVLDLVIRVVGLLREAYKEENFVFAKAIEEGDSIIEFLQLKI